MYKLLTVTIHPSIYLSTSNDWVISEMLIKLRCTVGQFNLLIASLAWLLFLSAKLREMYSIMLECIFFLNQETYLYSIHTLTLKVNNAFWMHGIPSCRNTCKHGAIVVLYKPHSKPYNPFPAIMNIETGSNVTN